MKTIAAISIGLIFSGAVTLVSQRPVSSSPLSVSLPSGYQYDGISFSKGTFDKYCSVRGATVITDKKIDLSDTSLFYSLFIISTYDKGKFTEVKLIDEKSFKRTYFQRVEKKTVKQFLVTVKGKNVHYLETTCENKNEADREEQRQMLLEAVWNEKDPNPVKDADFIFDDASIKLKMVSDDYPKVKYTDGKNTVEIYQAYKKCDPAKWETIFKNLTFTKLKNDDLSEQINEVAAGSGLKGKEVIYSKGKTRDEKEQWDYRAILFDPSGNFYILVRAQFMDDFQNRTLLISQLVKSIKIKEQGN